MNNVPVPVSQRPLRDQRVGRLLVARKCRAIHQAEKGGTAMDNVTRMAQWRNRYSLIPEELKLGKPV